MKSLQAYILPLKGLGDGVHHFNYTIDEDFFKSFEVSPIQKGAVDVEVVLDKRPKILVFDFSFTGRVSTSCDRCLSSIQLPIEGTNRLLVKYGEGESDNLDEDVVFISPETSSWSIAQFVYEYIVLALPLIKVYECQEEKQPPCDMQMLAKLNSTATPEEENKENNPFRDALKGWNDQPE